MESWNDMAPQPHGSGVQSIDRAVSILLCFSRHKHELGITEIAKATGLSTSTTHRLLMAMQHNRLIRQTANRRYSLGTLIFQLLGTGAAPTSLREAALATMTQLRDESDESIGLHELLPSNERVVVDQVESYQPLRRTYTELGVPIPLPYGAPGKTLLSFLPSPRREAVLRVPLESITPTSITDPDVLRAQLAEIRRDRFALSYSERTPGIRTVASPIFGDTGAIVGSLSLSAPEMRMPAERMVRLGPLLRDAGWEVSAILGATAENVELMINGAADSVDAAADARERH